MSGASDQPAAPLVVCLKWVPIRPEVDPLSGVAITDDRFSGLSPADQAALEWALRVGEGRGQPVLAVSVGTAAADAGLREALALGADGACRIHHPDPDSLTSRMVADGLAKACGSAALVFCGDHSLDRGSGSVPAFLAHRLGFGQALGCVRLEHAAADQAGANDSKPVEQQVVAERRLDQGRRERLAVSDGTVLSFEGGLEPRRAPLGAALAAADVTIPVVELPPVEGIGSISVTATGPYRPRARVLPAPTGSTLDRIERLTGVGDDRPATQQLELTPPEAAEVVLERLRQWGYLDER